MARYRFVASSSGFKPFTLDYANGMTIMRRIIFPRAQIPPTMDRYPSSTRQEDPLLHGRNEFFHANGNDRWETVRDHFGRRKPPRWTRWKILFAVHGRSSRVSSPPHLDIVDSLFKPRRKAHRFRIVYSGERENPGFRLFILNNEFKLDNITRCCYINLERKWSGFFEICVYYKY